MKRVVALIAAVIVCASFLVVSASAADSISTSMSFDWNRGGSIISGTFDIPRYDLTYVGRKSTGNVTAGSKNFTSVDQFILDSEQLYSGAVALYISYFYDTDATTDGTWIHQTGSKYEGFYTNDIGQVGSVPNIEFDYFTPAAGLNPSRGFRMTIDYAGFPHMPISALGVKRTSSAAQCYFTPNVTTNKDQVWYFLHVPSASVVAVDTSDELDALEGMADQIAAQNEILNAMYGDIVSICNQIYQVCGDMVEAQNLTNQYFSQIIPILNSMNATTSNIYALLQNQFALLLAAIQRESGNLQDVIIDESGNIQTVLRSESEAIQDAIDQAVVDLITYLDSVFQGAVGELPDQNETTGNLISDFGGTEQEIGNTLEEAFDQFISAEPVFDNQLIAGFSLINTIFDALWEGIGDFKFVYIFSLTLAIMLLAIGRLSKFAGVGSSKFGGPKKPPGKGGSDGA